MASHGLPWPPTAFRGLPRPSVASHGLPSLSATHASVAAARPVGAARRASRLRSCPPPILACGHNQSSRCHITPQTAQNHGPRGLFFGPRMRVATMIGHTSLSLSLSSLSLLGGLTSPPPPLSLSLSLSAFWLRPRHHTPLAYGCDPPLSVSLSPPPSPAVAHPSHPPPTPSHRHPSTSIPPSHRHPSPPPPPPRYVPAMETKGLEFVGRDTTGERMEVLELKGHPFFLAAQVRHIHHPHRLSRSCPHSPTRTLPHTSRPHSPAHPPPGLSRPHRLSPPFCAPLPSLTVHRFLSLLSRAVPPGVQIAPPPPVAPLLWSHLRERGHQAGGPPPIQVDVTQVACLLHMRSVACASSVGWGLLQTSAAACNEAPPPAPNEVCGLGQGGTDACHEALSLEASARR